MKILLSGAQGFLGGRVLDFLLEKKYRVRALVRRQAPELQLRGVEVHQADLRDAEAVRAATTGTSGVIHCAAKSGVWGSLNDYIEANTLSTINLLNAAKAAGASWFVHTSSPSVVHTGRALEGVDESAPYTSNHHNAYPYSKMLAEKIVLAANEASFRTTALRPHLIWGPNDPHFLPRLTAKAKSGRLFLLKSKALVDGTYIDNAAWAHILAAQKMMSDDAGKISGRAYFIAQGEPLTAAELIEQILAAVSTSVQPLKIKACLPAWLGHFGGAALEGLWNLLKLTTEPPLTRFIAEELTLPHWFNLSRAREELGYTAATSMAEGLRKMSQETANF